MHLNEMLEDESILPTVIITCDEDKGNNFVSNVVFSDVQNEKKTELLGTEAVVNVPHKPDHKDADYVNKETITKLKFSVERKKKKIVKRRKQSGYLNPIQRHYHFSKSRYFRRRVALFFLELRKNIGTFFSKTSCLEHFSCKRYTISEIKNCFVNSFLFLKKGICSIEKPTFDGCLPPHFRFKKSVYKLVEVIPITDNYIYNSVSFKNLKTDNFRKNKLSYGIQRTTIKSLD